MKARLRLLPEFLGVVVLGFALYAGMLALRGSIGSNPVLFPYDARLHKAPGDPLYRFLWFFGNVNEAEFYASLLGGIGILAFAFVAYRLDEAGSRWRGFPISYGFPSPTAPGFGPGSSPPRP